MYTNKNNHPHGCAGQNLVNITSKVELLKLYFFTVLDCLFVLFFLTEYLVVCYSSGHGRLTIRASGAVEQDPEI